MTYKEIKKLESDNLTKIILYKEGLFLRAYEKSAFSLCTLYGFKPIRRKVKSLGNQDIVYAGFPASQLHKYIGKELLEEQNDGTFVLDFGVPIEVEYYEEWVNRIPYSEPSVKTKPSADNMPKDIVGKLRSFNLADSTPLQCMSLVQELQSLV